MRIGHLVPPKVMGPFAPLPVILVTCGCVTPVTVPPL
jgi:hypothetical protein